MMALSSAGQCLVSKETIERGGARETAMTWEKSKLQRFQ